MVQISNTHTHTYMPIYTVDKRETDRQIDERKRE